MFVNVTVPVPADDGFDDEQNALKEPSNTLILSLDESFDELVDEWLNAIAIIIETIITIIIIHSAIPLFITMDNYDGNYCSIHLDPATR